MNNKYIPIGDWILVKIKNLVQNSGVFSSEERKYELEGSVFDCEVISAYSDLNAGDLILWGTTINRYVWVDKKESIVAIKKDSVIAVKDICHE